MEQNYNFKIIEKQAQDYWHKNKCFEVEIDNKKEKFYCLSMFPYPSGKLHIGHVRNYTIGDVIARTQIMNNKNVLQPIGWDAFGMPAENAALKNNIPADKWTFDNIEYMKKQLKSLGFAYDWQREFATCDESYYKWEQWFFIKLFKKGLIYKKEAIVNWDPVDKTVLANEQVIEGKGWRSGALVERKKVPQWFIRITDYAEQLLQDLEKLKNWPKKVLLMQQNWIGKSRGLNINFKVKDNQDIVIYTTRPDTIMGVTYLAISPDHKLSTLVAKNNPNIRLFLLDCKNMQTNEASLETMEKKGINSGLKCMHPITGEQIDIWITNFVLIDYGTGSVMCVPAHDQRDYLFAKKYDLPIKLVIKNKNSDESDIKNKAFTNKGILYNSGIFNNITSEQAFDKIAKYLGDKNLAEITINYRLKDWSISRQRKWGCPIPIINCAKCGFVEVNNEDLPITLEKQKNNTNVKCPKCDNKAKRETDTLDTFFESSWYYARFTCPDDTKNILNSEAINYWLPVDQYIGGVEHAILHLLYARFFHKLLRDEKLVNSDEPFTSLLTQGMVLKDKIKMSKSRGNVVDPQDMIKNYGSDAVRLFILFAAPPTQDLDWSESQLEGANRFLQKIYRLVYKFLNTKNDISLEDNIKQNELAYKTQITYKKVVNDLNKRFSFNTAIASIMELSNLANKFDDFSDNGKKVLKSTLEKIVLMLSPISPHIAHHLWHCLGYKESIIKQKWPKVIEQQKPSYQKAVIIIQINGKLKDRFSCDYDIAEKQVVELAKNREKIKNIIQEKKIIKTIFIINKLVNFVVNK